MHVPINGQSWWHRQREIPNHKWKKFQNKLCILLWWISTLQQREASMLNNESLHSGTITDWRGIHLGWLHDLHGDKLRSNKQHRQHKITYAVMPAYWWMTILRNLFKMFSQILAHLNHASDKLMYSLFYKNKQKRRYVTSFKRGG
jgi:hypothetical protein